MDNFNKLYNLIMQDYSKDMYSSVYEPLPEEQFDVKVGELFNIAERQIKKNPELLNKIQQKVDYSISKGTDKERSILLHIAGELRVLPISFEEKDIIKTIYNLYGENPDHYMKWVGGQITKMAKNIGLNV